MQPKIPNRDINHHCNRTQVGYGRRSMNTQRQFNAEHFRAESSSPLSASRRCYHQSATKSKSAKIRCSASDSVSESRGGNNVGFSDVNSRSKLLTSSMLRCSTPHQSSELNIDSQTLHFRLQRTKSNRIKSK